MKASELIEKLEEQKAKHGDLNVQFQLMFIDAVTEHFVSERESVYHSNNIYGNQIIISGSCP